MQYMIMEEIWARASNRDLVVSSKTYLPRTTTDTCLKGSPK